VLYVDHGATKPIERVEPGDEVLSCYGSGEFRPARVLRAHRSNAFAGVSIRLASGRQLVSTPEHMHFAGYVVGRTPQLHMTYLMWKHGVGFRVGTSRTYTNGQAKAVFGPAFRCNGEGGDAVWVIGTHATDSEARLHEAALSARYGLPTLPFKARRSSSGKSSSLVGNQVFIDRLFADLDTEKAGYALLADED